MGVDVPVGVIVGIANGVAVSCTVGVVCGARDDNPFKPLRRAKAPTTLNNTQANTPKPTRIVNCRIVIPKYLRSCDIVPPPLFIGNVLSILPPEISCDRYNIMTESGLLWQAHHLRQRS